MTFDNLKKQIEEEVAILERHFEKYPKPNINDRDVVPDYLWTCAEKAGKLDTLKDILNIWPQIPDVVTKKKKYDG